MSMDKVLILTKTNWSEAPRIRHQITRLLKSKGFEIIYVEKNAYKNVFVRKRNEEGIQFYAHAELVHHQLRYFSLIQWANNLVVQFYLRKIIREIDFDFIFNFSYDYSFLKKVAPGKKVITMIEDDFESQAKFGMTNAIRNQVTKTCAQSDFVLTVSYPLMKKLKTYGAEVHMMFPWSQNEYVGPVRSRLRNTVLYFGYVHRLDWDIVERLVRESVYNFRFVGPAGRSKDTKMIGHLKSTYNNFEYIPFSSISDLKVDDAFCSILPYDPQIKSVQACTISNRAFNLLSLGLPLAYASLDALIEAPDTVIRKNKTVEDYHRSLDLFSKSFYEIQSDIKDFLDDHYSENRWRVLKSIIDRLEVSS